MLQVPAIAITEAETNNEIKSLIEELGNGPPGDNNPATEKIIAIGKLSIPHLVSIFENPPDYKNKNGLSNEHWVRLRAAHCLMCTELESYI